MSNFRQSLIITSILSIGFMLGVYFLSYNWLVINLSTNTLNTETPTMFLTGMSMLVFLPNLLAVYIDNKNQMLLFLSVVCLVIVAGIIVFPAPALITIKMMSIVAGFSLMILAAGRGALLVGAKAARLLVAFLSMFFISSPFWSGGIDLRYIPLELKVWLAPQAYLSLAFEGFNFAHLPGVYHVWLGPIAPLPDNIMNATGAYFIPGVVLLLITYTFSNSSFENEEKK